MPNRSENTPTVVDMNTALEKPKEMEGLLVARYDQLEAMLEGSGITPNRFIGSVVHALAAADGNVRAAPKGEVLLAVLEAAKMGLEPTGAYGGGYLVKPRGKPVSFWVDWRGYIKGGMRSGQLRKADPFIVFENDEFDYVLGDEQYIHHRPFIGTDEERGQPRFAYAILELTNGAKVREVMSWDEIMAIMKRAPAGEKGPWGSDPLEMARKTVIRRVFKRVPVVVTPHLAYALSQEDAEWEEARNTVSVEPVTAQGGRRGRILDRLGGGSSTDATPAEPPLEEAGETTASAQAAEDAERATATESDEGIPE